MQLTFQRDHWLADTIGREAWRTTVVAVDGGATSASRQIAAQLHGLPRPLFCYARLPTAPIENVSELTDAGFRVIDVAVTLELLTYSKPDPATFCTLVRQAQPADWPDVLTLAEEAFIYSRFHLDPQIGRALANRIKRCWMESCLAGRRGDRVYVAECDGHVAGFLAAIRGTNERGATAVIDLIAVRSDAQRLGVGTALIHHFVGNYASHDVELRVGTQVANIPSLRLYEKCGFRMCGSQYVLHGHFE